MATVSEAERQKLLDLQQELHRTIGEARAIVRDATALEAHEPLTDEQRDRIKGDLEQQSDCELVSALLTVHKLAENEAKGRLRELLERQGVVLTTALNRFAPVAFGDALAVWFEHLDDEGDDNA